MSTKEGTSHATGFWIAFVQRLPIGGVLDSLQDGQLSTTVLGDRILQRQERAMQ